MTSWTDRLVRLDSAAVSDALDKLALTGVALGLRRLSTDRRICGRVVTVQLADDTGGPSTQRHLATAAVEAAGPGDVVVVANSGRTDVAGWGGKLSLASAQRGVAGIVIDGACRDLEETQDAGVALFARCAVPVSARGRVVEQSWNIPVTVCGVPVEPGDWVIADATGVVFIPASSIERVVETAEGIAASEASAAARIKAGEPISQVMGKSYERALKPDVPAVRPPNAPPEVTTST